MRKQEFRFQTNLPSPARRGSRSRTASPPAPLAIRKAPSASVESIQPRPPGTWPDGSWQYTDPVEGVGVAVALCLLQVAQCCWGTTQALPHRSKSAILLPASPVTLVFVSIPAFAQPVVASDSAATFPFTVESPRTNTSNLLPAGNTAGCPLWSPHNGAAGQNTSEVATTAPAIFPLEPPSQARLFRSR